MSITRNSDGSRKVIGSTTMSTIGGAQAGLLIAILITEVFGLELSTEATQGLACLLALGGMLLGGWLSPSKEAEARQVIEDYKIEQELAKEPEEPAEVGPVATTPGAPQELQVNPEAMTVSMAPEGVHETLF